MTREDAYYERILLLCGCWDTFDGWIDTYLNEEDPLSDIVLDLLDCRQDMKRAEYLLHLYCLEKPFDEESVYERLRAWVCERYETKEWATDSVTSMLFRFSKHIPPSSFSNQCLTLSDYYCLVEEGVIEAARFEAVLEKWLRDGGEVQTDEMYSRRKKGKSVC